MSPSSGHAAIPQAIKSLKYLISKGSAFLKTRLQPTAESGRLLEAIPVRIPKRPLTPVEALRQGRSQQRNFSTAIRRIILDARGPIQSARAGTGCAIRSALSKSNNAPFASQLRPNLTGGALPRSAGGYSLGGRSIRHFSSAPAVQAQVLHNVSAAVRAFCINGSKVQYDGTDKKTGTKRFRTITTLQEKALRSIHESKRYSKGTTLEFRLAPLITAIPAFEDANITLGSEGIVGGLASDFSRSLSTLAAIHADLKKLAVLGSLPITHPDTNTLHVRFSGCDATTVYALCNELGVQRGIVREDAGWSEEDGDKDVEMALLFPWAPSHAPSENLFEPKVTMQPVQNLDWCDMMTGSKAGSTIDPAHEDLSVVHAPDLEESSLSWQDVSYASSFDALQASDIQTNDELTFGSDLARLDTARPAHDTRIERMEDVLRYLEQCEGGR